jgi:hypothetical protein
VGGTDVAVGADAAVVAVGTAAAVVAVGTTGAVVGGIDVAVGLDAAVLHAVNTMLTRTSMVRKVYDKRGFISSSPVKNKRGGRINRGECLLTGDA